MKPALILLAAATALLAGCASTQLHAPVRHVRYNAIGAEPFWLLTIGDERIVLSFGRQRGGMRDSVYRRGPTRMEDGVRRWAGGEGAAVIGVEAWRRPCRGAGGAMFEDVVRVRLSGRELNGCGGRLVDGKNGR
jgi:hypothetical protein